MRQLLHEIRNHLAIASANVEAFYDGKLVPTPVRLAAVLQALREVDALLGALHPGATVAAVRLHSEPRPINVCDIITNEVMGFEASASAQHITFKADRCDARDLCLGFAGDPLRIGEIVNNLVSNAIRYTPAGGTVEIDCRRVAGTLTLSVTDEGPGVSEADRERIFEPGFRGAASAGTKGSGLGLSLVRHFVEEHGGSIAVENVVDRGARFTVKLPGVPLPVRARRSADGTLTLL